MRRSITTPLISGLVLVAFILGWRMFAQVESTRFAATERVAHSKSAIHLRLRMRHEHGAITAEEYALQDLDGVSTASYAATDRRSGTTARFTEPIRGYAVAFLFEELVRDGIWELRDRPPRGDTSTTYDVSVAQTVGGKSGRHAFTVTDPHYWATTGGQQFKLHLDRNHPVPDLLTLKSTSIAEPRYDKVIRDFQAFGTPAFRATIAKARERAQHG